MLLVWQGEAEGLDEDAEQAANHLLESVPDYNGEDGWEVATKPANIKHKKSQVIAQKFPNGWHRGRIRGQAKRQEGQWEMERVLLH